MTRRCVLVVVALLLLACEGSEEPVAMADAGVSDAAVSDAAVSDAAVRDAGTSDAATVDAATPSVCDAMTPAGCLYQPEDHPIGNVEGYQVPNPTYSRPFPILIRYPTDISGPVPVIIASHGGTFNDNGHRLLAEWGRVLARAGYVVIHVAHVELGPTTATTVCMRFGVPRAECEASSGYNPSVALKALDAVALLDDLGNVGAWLQMIAGVELDPTRIATIGWSGGSQTGLTLLGAVRDLSPSVRFSNPDMRIAGSMALSPQGPGFSGYFETMTETSMDGVTRPVLIATGDNDHKPTNPTLLPSIRRRTWENLPGAGGTQRLLFSLLPRGVGGHGTYNLGDQGSADARLARLSQALESAARAFFDATLQNDAAARDYLDSSAPGTLAGDAQWRAR